MSLDLTVDPLERYDLMTGSDFKGYTFYKITNSKEIHRNFKYKNGLNVLDKGFDVYGSCAPGGLYFTTLEHLHHYYYYGIWIRKITLPDDAQVVKDSHGNKWRADKIILGERYYLYSLDTITKFDLMMTRGYVRAVTEVGGGIRSGIPPIGNKRQIKKLYGLFCKLSILGGYYFNNNPTKLSTYATQRGMTLEKKKFDLNLKLKLKLLKLKLKLKPFWIVDKVDKVDKVAKVAKVTKVTKVDKATTSKV